MSDLQPLRVDTSALETSRSGGAACVEKRRKGSCSWENRRVLKCSRAAQPHASK